MLHRFPIWPLRRYLPILIFIAGCQPAAPPVESAPKDNPLILNAPSKCFTKELPPLIRDENGLPKLLSVAWPVVNDTEGILHFEGVRHSCTCTNAIMDVMTLAPGAQTTLQMKMDLRNRTGPQRFSCNAMLKGGREWSYEATTTIYESAKMDAFVYSFGLLDPGATQEKEGSLALFAAAESEFPERVVFQVDSKQVQLVELPSAVDKVEEGIYVRRYPFRLTVQSSNYPGVGHGTLIAAICPTKPGALLGKNEDRVLRTSIVWNTRSLYEVTPAQVFFANPDGDKADSLEKTIDLRRTDGKDLRVVGLGKIHPAIQCSVEKSDSAERARLRVRIDPKLFAESMWHELIVETDHPVQPKVRIPIAALVKTRPEGTSKTN